MIPAKRVNHKNKSAYAKGGFVEDFARGYNYGESAWGGDDSDRKKRKKNQDPFPDAPGGGLYADGGKVGTISGMIPKALHGIWGMIPSVADKVVTGKWAASPEEYDAAKERKDAEIEARRKK